MTERTALEKNFRYRKFDFMTGERDVTVTADRFTGMVEIKEDLEGDVSVLTLTIEELLKVATGMWGVQPIAKEPEIQYISLA